MDLLLASEFKDYVVRVFKRTDKNTEIYDAITDAVIDMRARHPFDEFKNEAYSDALTTLGNYKLDIPSEMGHFIGDIRVFKGTDHYDPLVKRSKEQFDRLYPNPNSTTSRGVPKHFCVYGSQILLGPVPDSLEYLYEVNYSEELFYEFSGTDTSAYVPFSGSFREVLRAGVLARLYFMLDNDAEAGKWESVYERGVERMIKRDVKNTYTTGMVAYNDI